MNSPINPAINSLKQDIINAYQTLLSDECTTWCKDTIERHNTNAIAEGHQACITLMFPNLTFDDGAGDWGYITLVQPLVADDNIEEMMVVVMNFVTEKAIHYNETFGLDINDFAAGIQFTTLLADDADISIANDLAEFVHWLSHIDSKGDSLVKLFVEHKQRCEA